jgi:hypothetical protein
MTDSTKRRRFRHKHEGGQVLPALLVLVLGPLVLGMALLQLGRASTMRAQGQTAADAAALAGARELERHVKSSLAATGPLPREQIGPDLVFGVLDQGPALTRHMEAAERDYAGRNGARLLAADRPGPLEAWVEVEADAEGRRARAQARARVVVTFAAVPPLSGLQRVDPLDYMRFDVRLASGP